MQLWNDFLLLRNIKHFVAETFAVLQCDDSFEILNFPPLGFGLMPAQNMGLDGVTVCFKKRDGHFEVFSDHLQRKKRNTEKAQRRLIKQFIKSYSFELYCVQCKRLNGLTNHIHKN